MSSGWRSFIRNMGSKLILFDIGWRHFTRSIGSRLFFSSVGYWGLIRGVTRRLNLKNFVILFVEVLWGMWRPGVKYALLFPICPGCHELLKLYP